MHENNTADSFGPEDLDAFIQRAFFRSPNFRVSRIGGTPDDPKFTYHTVDLEGPNWQGYVRISIIGKAWWSACNSPYHVIVAVQRTDGSEFMQPQTRSEKVADFGQELRHGKIEKLPDPESLYPLIFAALDENEDRFCNYHVEGDADLAKIVYTISGSLIHYFKGARLLPESVEIAECLETIDPDDLDMTGVKVREAIDWSPEDFEDFGEVATDILYATDWERHDSGIINKKYDIWEIRLNCPMKPFPFTGYIASFKGSEAPWLLVCNIDMEYSPHGKYIIGYTKTEPTPKLLDQVRAAALQSIKSYVNFDEEPPEKSSQVAKAIAANIQAHIRTNPEVLALNLVTEAIEDVGSFVDDFFMREGIEDWKRASLVVGVGTTLHRNEGFNFRFNHLTGGVFFYDFTYDNRRCQSLLIQINDNRSLHDYSRSFTGSWQSTRSHRWFVPDDQIDQFKAALVELIGVKVRNMSNRRLAAGSSLLPSSNGAITQAVLNLLRPWMILDESVDPEEIMRDFLAHGGGPPFEWQEEKAEGLMFRRFILRIPWLDGSHTAMIVLTHQPEFGERHWTVYMVVNARDPGHEFRYSRAIVHTLHLRIEPRSLPKVMKIFEEFAKWLIAFTTDAPIEDVSTTEVDRMRKNEIVVRFEYAARKADLTESLEMDPEEFLKDFDLMGTKGDWITTEGDFPNPYVLHVCKLVHKNEFRPFNDEITVQVCYFKPYEGDAGHTVVDIGYKHRGWNEVRKSVAVLGKSDAEVLPIVDRMIDQYFVKKITANAGTSGMISWFMSKLKKNLREQTGAVSVSQIPESKLPTPRLTFRTENTAVYSGQSNYTLYAYVGEDIVGRIDFVEYQGGITVQWIETAGPFQRRGIATAMAKELQRQYPTVEIEWSNTTPEGAGFLQGLDRDYEPNLTYEKAKAAYDAAKAEYAILQAEFDKYEGPPLAQNPEMFKKGERMNELDDQIWGLEQVLQDMKPGRHMIREGMEDWSEEDVDKFVAQAVTCTVEWTTSPYVSDAGWTATDWVMRISAPYGQLSQDRPNRLLMRFYTPEGDGLIRAAVDLTMSSPHHEQNGYGRDFVSHIDHINLIRYVVIRPGEEEALRKAVEAEFFRSIGNYITELPPEKFDLAKYEKTTKANFTRLQRKWWVEGAPWIVPH